MKKLKKILLINWLYFSKEVIEVGDVNFLTGKNGAGKSTVIDALQIVLLGETNARNFNLAANERSQRTLDGYLRADMDENNPYSRRGKDFSTYIVCEFEDDVEHNSFVCGVMFVVQHPESANFSPTNLFNPAKFEFGGTMSAVSLAVMSYVGFGAIATLTQEAKDPKHGPSRAMMVMAILLCVLYALQCFIATCIDPSGAAFAGNTDNAFYAVAKMAAGPWLMVVCAVGVALAQGVFTAIAQQNSIAFVMFTMANGGCLPKFMAKMNKRTNSPLNAVIFIIALSVVLTLLFHFSGIDMNTVVKISNFGALSTYVMLNVSVIVFCWFQLKQRKGAKAVFMRLVFPALGALVCFAILMSVGTVALVTGVVFILIGIAYYLVLTRVLHRQINLG